MGQKAEGAVFRKSYARDKTIYLDFFIAVEYDNQERTATVRDSPDERQPLKEYTEKTARESGNSFHYYASLAAGNSVMEEKGTAKPWAKKACIRKQRRIPGAERTYGDCSPAPAGFPAHKERYRVFY